MTIPERNRNLQNRWKRLSTPTVSTQNCSPQPSPQCTARCSSRYGGSLRNVSRLSQTRRQDTMTATWLHTWKQRKCLNTSNFTDGTYRLYKPYEYGTEILSACDTD